MGEGETVEENTGATGGGSGLGASKSYIKMFKCKRRTVSLKSTRSTERF